MKVSLNWLKDYVDLTDISIEEIIDKLTISGLEVEDVDDKRKRFENFVVGFVKEKSKHPNADKLSVCIVSTGDKEYNVVCGAPNVAAGQKVAFAKIGAYFPEENFKISKAKIRGVTSEGMICSERELGISNNHDGIMVLDSSIPDGTPLANALGLDDVVLELGITPNRPDALSHTGVARDIAAIFKKELKMPKIALNEIDEKASDYASIEVINSKGCPRYSARIVKNVTINESPDWLKQKLTAVGLRPINNIVDITNFILHELNQPLHSFDLDRLSGKKIVIKNAADGEIFTTLDSKERKLSSNDLMICDGEKPVAIAGVMGGENSEVTIDTKNILIESAYFNSVNVRKTSKSLGLSTDASYRFERGTDPNGTVFAADRAAQLMAELGGGEVLQGIIDVYPEEIKPLECSLRYTRVERVLGYYIAVEEIKDIIRRLGITIISENGDLLQLSSPTYRPDLEREIDIIEEIARIYGYEKIPAVDRISITLNEKNDESQFRDLVRDTATSLGYYEIISNSMLQKDLAELSGNPIELLNPISQDMAVLRTSLIEGALSVVSKNLSVGEKNLKLFEIGNVFNKNTSDEIKGFQDFTETEKLIFVITGKTDISWFEKERPFDFYDLKGGVDSFLTKIYLDNGLKDSYNSFQNNTFEYIYTKSHKGIEVGRGGKVNKNILKKFDIGQDVFIFEFNFTELSKIKAESRRFKELLKYPKVFRDSAFIIDKSITGDKVIDEIYKGSKGLLKNVKIFDIFEKETLGIDKKSMAFTLEYFDENRTLTDDEVEKDFNSSVAQVIKELSAEFRGL